MRQIIKGREPESLAAHRQGLGSDDDPRWDDYRDKSGAFEALCREQGYLCAYCMRRIRPDQDPRKIEHWISQNHDPDSPHAPSVHKEHRFKWTNLLGVCPGGASRIEPSPRAGQHCDSYRGNTPLHVHPALSPTPVETYFAYRNDGTIWSGDPQAMKDIEALNLNVGMLKKNRGRVFAELKKTLGNGSRNVSMLRRELNRWRGRAESIRHQHTTNDLWTGADMASTRRGMRLREYCQVAIFFLERQIRKRP